VQIEGAMLFNELLRELSHLRATGRTNCTHHVATFSSLFHGCLVIGHSFLLLTFHAEHFSQSIFPPTSDPIDLSG
jgi:hypothetical protein